MLETQQLLNQPEHLEATQTAARASRVPAVVVQSFVSFLLGALYFRRTERFFADYFS
jgi:hypothetical protein